MIVWVLYDIEDDKARAKTAKFCKQAGLYRVQFSVFLGTIDSSQKDTLILQIEGLIDVEKDPVPAFQGDRYHLVSILIILDGVRQAILSI